MLNPKKSPYTTPLDAAPGMEHWTAKRRDFLRMMGYGASAAAVAPLLAACGDANSQSSISELRSRLVQDEAFWTQVQSMFVLNPQRTYMNIGTGGSMPQVVLDVFAKENLLKAEDSSSGYGNLLDLRQQVAPGFGVDADELAFSANTSSGMCHAILGIDWQKGDVVVTTNAAEHSGGALRHRSLAHRHARGQRPDRGHLHQPVRRTHTRAQGPGQARARHDVVFADLRDRHHAADRRTHAGGQDP